MLFDVSRLIYMHGNTPADYRECRLQYTQVGENERNVCELGYLSKSLDTIERHVAGTCPKEKRHPSTSAAPPPTMCYSSLSHYAQLILRGAQSCINLHLQVLFCMKLQKGILFYLIPRQADSTLNKMKLRRVISHIVSLYIVYSNWSTKLHFVQFVLNYCIPEIVI